MAGSYYTGGVSAPTVVEGLLLQAESRVLLGDAYLYGSLETSSWTYGAYTASIGLADGHAIDLGMLSALGFSHVPTFEAVESANIQDSTIWTLNGEETKVTVGLRQFDVDVLRLAIGTGDLYMLNDDTEALMPFGGKCTMTTRPLVIEFANVACGAPSSENVAAGITGGVITLYDVFAGSGLPWDSMDAKALNEITIEFQARPVLAHARGNRLGNVYVW